MRAREGRLTLAGTTGHPATGGSAALRMGAGSLPRRPQEATPPLHVGHVSTGCRLPQSALGLAWACRPEPCEQPQWRWRGRAEERGPLCLFGGSTHSTRPWKQREELFVALVQTSQTNSKSGGHRTRLSPSRAPGHHTHPHRQQSSCGPRTGCSLKFFLHGGPLKVRAQLPKRCHPTTPQVWVACLHSVPAPARALRSRPRPRECQGHVKAEKVKLKPVDVTVGLGATSLPVTRQ